MNTLERMQELETKMSLIEDKLLELTHNVLAIKNQNTATINIKKESITIEHDKNITENLWLTQN